MGKKLKIAVIGAGGIASGEHILGYGHEYLKDSDDLVFDFLVNN